MTEHDPLDDLLRDAFAADLARTPTVHVADRVIARIRRRQRIRALTLAGFVMVGLLVLAMSVEPALAAIVGLVNQNVPAEWRSNSLAFGVLAVVGAAWLMVMDWEWW